MFRVECNNGSKYFKKGIDAYAYFEKMKKDPMLTVSLWLVITRKLEKPFYIRQELIAY